MSPFNVCTYNLSLFKRMNPSQFLRTVKFWLQYTQVPNIPFCNWIHSQLRSPSSSKVSLLLQKSIRNNIHTTDALLIVHNMAFIIWTFPVVLPFYDLLSAMYKLSVDFSRSCCHTRIYITDHITTFAVKLFSHKPPCWTSDMMTLGISILKTLVYKFTFSKLSSKCQIFIYNPPLATYQHTCYETRDCKAKLSEVVCFQSHTCKRHKMSGQNPNG